MLQQVIHGFGGLAPRRDILPRMRVRLAACALVILTLGGCQRSLFPPNTPRTQYEAHDRLRNQWAPKEQLDEYGSPQPALRERLSRRR